MFKINKKFRLLLLWIAIYIMLIFSISRALEQSASFSNKLDPRLRILMNQFERTRMLQSHSVELINQNTSATKVGLLVKAKENPQNLIQNFGGSVGSVHGNIYTVRLPIQSITGLVSENSIEYLEASQVLYPDLSSRLTSGTRPMIVSKFRWPVQQAGITRKLNHSHFCFWIHRMVFFQLPMTLILH